MTHEEIREAYKEDTVGRKYHPPIHSKKSEAYKKPPAEPPITLNLKRPMGRDEFNGLSDSLKVIYIKHLHETYGATATQIANMLGYSVGHFSRKIVSRLNLNGLFKRGSSVSEQQLKAWDEFLGNNTDEDVTPKLSSDGAVPLTKVCDCSFTLKGALTISEIADKIQAMVKEGTFCYINVSIEVLEENQQ